jgi:copper chaperone
MQTTEIRIEGMSCGGCVANITKKLQALAGVTSVEVMLSPGLAKVSFDESAISQSEIENIIEEAGFDVVR